MAPPGIGSSTDNRSNDLILSPNSKNIVVLDGGFATQLSCHVDQPIDGDVLWSARFLATDPEAVIDTHLDFLRVLSGLLAVALGAALQEPVPILSETNEQNPDGSYQWSYQSGDGASQQQAGELRQIGHDKGEVVQGAATWYDPEGGLHQLSYVADENGYQPQSSDVPVAPAIPPAILRALQWIAAHPHVEKRHH